MARVRTGLETLSDSGFAALKGPRIGLVTNPTGILPDRTANIAALRAAGVKLAALLGPEHGVRGDVPAGEYVASSTDPQTRLPVHSLYGPTRTPTAAMLRGLDLLLFDLQDIGARSYTYLSTLGAVLTASARHRIPVLVLDRPNPLGGVTVEGGPVRPGFASFIGRYPSAYRHGLTLGEAARWLVGTGQVGKASVQVIPCANLTRTMAGWEAFGGLPWVRTSPNVPQPQTALFYTATGIAGELKSLSIGIGTPTPFELAGRPEIDPAALAKALESELPSGTTAAPAPAWTPSKGVFAGRRCRGVRLTIADPGAPSTRTNFALLTALRRLGVTNLFGDSDAARMFDLSCGTDRVRKAFLKGADTAELQRLFDDGADSFRTAREPYLLYKTEAPPPR